MKRSFVITHRYPSFVRSKRVSLVLSVLAVSLFAFFNWRVEATGQHESRGEPFMNIPADLRPRLRQRLKLFISFQSKRQWEKMYGLSIEPIQQSSLSKAEFINNQVEGDHNPYVSTLLEFTPQSAVFTNEYGSVREWTIEGCAKYLRKGKVVYLDAGINAVLTDKQWYFSKLYSTLDAVDGMEKACTPTRNVNRELKGAPLGR